MNQYIIDSPFFLDVSTVRGHEVARILADPTVLAVLAMGNALQQHADPRYIQIPLQYAASPMLEVWKTNSPVDVGRHGDVSWASNGSLFFGRIELEESPLGLETCTERIYRQIGEVLHRYAMPAVLRMWTIFDAICEGAGDDERYRRFCVGRTRGLRFFPHAQFPAATAVGRQDGRRVVQVYWLASRRAGCSLENPRQISAYHYPRTYGPQPPSFARAMLAPSPPMRPLFISGTASIVGHVSMHVDDIAGQLDEILVNLRALLQHAHHLHPIIPSWFTSRSYLKVYIRDARWIPQVHQMLARLLPHTPHVLLQATICRKDLLLEIEGIHW